MQVDRRTTEEVEASRCMRNDKPYRNKEQKADAKDNAKIVKGTKVSYTPRTQHEYCSCSKRSMDQCSKTASGRNSRVKRLRNS